ncbi:MAG: molybdopterin-guanine dinucleotide biosynthesis protein B [Methanomicrobiales archaeon HGW-Methanomicrobiales-1]|jgi:molybdopterin-guanine dinucleotide biosynthesis protein MobB|nr:MAG: molybdopterin-guanine dinucleotide biosynthesis protein B [Methanomicrobiales archaeon HGW-Methanomicrobiales-1]
MKIIQVVGRSNSGKTTFIKQLIPILKTKGHVAVIKHLGDHEYVLEEGKDTTGFFEAGADVSVGIDADKSVAAIRNNSLEGTLRLLFDQGMNFTVIEGFKQIAYPRIVIGNLETDHCVLSNPRLDEVLASLNSFEDFCP